MEKTCKNCGAPIAKQYCEDNYPEVCEHWAPKKIKTNGDRIRAMSDEGLANFLVDISVDPVSRCDCCADAKRCTNKCIGGIMRWLKQPAE